MRMGVLQITSGPIGKGKERTCYVHPDDPTKLIKISGNETSKQTKREVALYKKLLKQKEFQYTHVPKFYGLVKTNLGDGFIVDLILDHDKKISRSLQWYLQQGCPISEFEPYLDELKSFFLENLVIFNLDMYSGNILFQKLSKTKARLVTIDGIGDVVFIKWLNVFPSHVRSKIQRRWQRFISQVYTSSEVKNQSKAISASPDKHSKTLRPNY